LIRQYQGLEEENLVFGFLAFLVFNDGRGAGLLHQPPNLEDQVIFDQGFLPLAFDTPVSRARGRKFGVWFFSISCF